MISPARLATEAFVAPGQPRGTRELARRGRFTPEIVATPGSLVAALGQVSLGMGIAIVPSMLAAVVQIPNVVFRPIDGEPIPSEIAAVFRSNEPSPPVKRFIEQILLAPPEALKFPLR
jgi:DNA-binding transcriptional LysR family regulator